MCNEPMPVRGAKVSYPSLSVHASATYRCSEGYRAAGGHFSHTCQVDGTWSGQRPTCEGQCNDFYVLLCIDGNFLAKLLLKYFDCFTV